MLLIFLGIITLFLAFAMNNPSFQFSKYAKYVRNTGFLFIILGLLFATIIQVGPGKTGVQTLFGQIQNRTLSSGLSFVNPLVDIQEIDVKTQEFTMSAVHDEGEKLGDDAIKVLSADGLEIGIDITILYRVDEKKVTTILKEIGPDYKAKIIRPITRTKIRDNAVYYEAVSLYSTKRNEFQARIFKEINTDFSKRGFVLEQILVRNIDLPKSVKTAIESKINAEQDAQKMQFVLLKEKQEAERKRVEAQGIADYQRIINTGLTDKQIQYEMIKAQKEIATSPNAKVIFMNGKSTPVILGEK